MAAAKSKPKSRTVRRGKAPSAKVPVTDTAGRSAAIDLSLAIIEYSTVGTIVTANDTALKMLGYTREELVGQHHRMLTHSGSQGTDASATLWAKLGVGERESGQYRRVDKAGRPIWIQASYEPIRARDGKQVKVLELATDVTSVRTRSEACEMRFDAMGRALAFMECTKEGTVLQANQQCMTLFGYTLEEMLGKRIGEFFDAALVASPAYRQSWESVARGECQVAKQVGLGKDGKRVWVMASHAPILDEDGNVAGIGVYLTDVTELGTFDEQTQSTVRETIETAAYAANGDLTRRVDSSGKSGVFVDLSNGINALIDATAAVVSRVQAAASEVKRGAGEISQGNLDLSQRTEQQAASLEETASSMEEMTSQVKQNADNAKQASQLAMAARDQADKGGSVVSKAVAAMTGINDASKKIVDIIGVIDEIAFQTNLLALNAAVEAARAGDQGRGFAVVASEVRNLASRSATAAKEIKALIQDSVRKVEEGSTLVTQSGQTLEQIMSSVKKVSDIIGEIAASSQEQSLGIEQVNKAVMQLDEVTQQNAALVEEATAASQSLADQATSLSALVEHYQTNSAASEDVKSSVRPERRTADRPWSKPGKGAQAAVKPQTVAPPVAATGTSDEWSEF